MASSELWINAVRESVAGYRKMVDAAVVQLTDEELNRRPSIECNSVAIIMRHLAGNLQSRWTDFLTSDGEKPNRNRDAEFTDWQGDRESLMRYFDAGWKTLDDAIDLIATIDASQTILIRGEKHSVADALVRSVTHLSYHVGQIHLIARGVHDGIWKWTTIAPGKSGEHNATTWGTSASRAIMGEKE